MPRKSPAPAWALLACVFAVPAAAESYNIDVKHSQVLFRVRHMMVSRVTGRFTRFSGVFDYVPGQPAQWKAQAAINVDSINTDIEDRDKHLRGPDFFDAEKCPVMEFKSHKVSAAKGKKAKLHGDLTMRCVTKPVVLDLEVFTDPAVKNKIGATAAGRIKRSDFGVVWNRVLEAGGVAVSDEVEIILEIEGDLKKD